ncbi:ornithine decarboxylase [Acanthocystis turfacea Chlorella virus Br0604L]|nr:ornithine decarboxylase [Acanthocystis turfacea Chlorella virus Br0604L]
MFSSYTITSMKDAIRQVLLERVQEKSFYVCDPKFVERLVDEWYRMLPSVHPFYAVKCNDDPVLLKYLEKNGVNFDCASKGEIAKVLNAGAVPSRVLFAHTIKSPEALLYAKSVGVNIATFDSTFELDKMKLYHPECEAVLRIRCDDPHALVKLEKYGANADEVIPLLEHAKRVGINVKGISFHVGSGSRNPDAYWKALKSTREAYDTALALGHNISIIDIGGGMYADIEDDGEVTSCVAGYIMDGIEDFFSGINVEFIAEPGRFFAQHYSVLACQIVGKRIRDGFYEYFVNESTYGAFSNVIYEKAVPEPIPVRDIDDDEPKHVSVIYGCTCDGIDVINKQTHLPELHIDDWIYFERWGAYTKVLHTSFNSFGQYDVFYV